MKSLNPNACLHQIKKKKKKDETVKCHDDKIGLGIKQANIQKQLAIKLRIFQQT